MYRRSRVRCAVLWWADMLVDGTFFAMQIYLTDVWELSFTDAATLLNIWAGIHKILPLFFLFIADTFLGNFFTLGLSTIFSTTGLIVITVTARAGYKCHYKSTGAESSWTSSSSFSCAGHAEKAVFIFGMALIALGLAARFACMRLFLRDHTYHYRDQYQINNNDEENWSNKIFAKMMSILRVLVALLPYIVIFVVIGVPFFVFPYVKKWYLLWGVAAIFMAIATIVFFCGNFNVYRKPKPRAEGSPVTDFVRVFVAAAFNMSQPCPKPDDPRLYKHVTLREVDKEEFKELSPSRLLGFLHKAALKVDDDDDGNEGKKMRSWRFCSVSEVESAKILIRMVPVHATYLMCGVISSIGNTYFVEQATHMNYTVGSWKPPLQLLQLFFMLCKFLTKHTFSKVYRDGDMDAAHNTGTAATAFSVVCCTVAAAVERRRVHVVRRHGLLDQPDDVKIPMSAFWLLFQILFLGIVEGLHEKGLSEFHKEEAPNSMRSYRHCLDSGVIGLGYMCGALSVYIVGKVSRMGSGKGWFQHTLNRSRLDRYYWVLSILATLNIVLSIVVGSIYRRKNITSLNVKAKDKPTTHQEEEKEEEEKEEKEEEEEEEDVQELNGKV